VVRSGGEIQLSDNAAPRTYSKACARFRSNGKTRQAEREHEDSAEMQVSQRSSCSKVCTRTKKIGRNEERIFTAGEKPVKIAEKQRLSGTIRSSDGSEVQLEVQVLGLRWQETRFC